MKNQDQFSKEAHMCATLGVLSWLTISAVFHLWLIFVPTAMFAVPATICNLVAFRRQQMQRIAVLMLVLVSFASAASAQNKVSIQLESAYSEISTSWKMPSELVARRIAFDTQRFHPVTNILTVSADPNQFFSAVVKTDINTMHQKSDKLNPLTDNIFHRNTFSDHIRDHEFEATGTFHYHYLDAGGGWTRFGISETTETPAFNGILKERFDHINKAFMVNIGGHYSFTRVRFGGAVRKYLRATQTEILEQNLGSYYNEKLLPLRGQGFDLSVAANVARWIEVTGGYNYRTLTNPKGAYFGPDVYIKSVTSWHTFGAGVVFKF